MSNPRPQRKRKQGDPQKKQLPTASKKVITPPEEKQPTSFTRSASVSFSEEYSGPLIHPRIIAQWEELCPGAAKIVIDEFQAQASHRRNLENHVINSDMARAKWGLAAGFIVSLAAMGVAVFAVYYNQPWVAGTVGGGTLATLAGVFIYGSQTRRAERERKAKDNP